MRKFFAFWVLIAAQLLAGCSLAPKDTGQAHIFTLAPVSALASPASGPSDETLVVALPVTAPELDTFRVSLLRDGRVWDYYAGARWAGFLTQSVQDNLVRSLEKARLFKSVTPDQSGVAGDKVLKVEIRDFQARYSPDMREGGVGPVVTVRLVATLMAGVTREKLATFDARAQSTAAVDSLPDIQTSFSKAFDEAQLKLIREVARRGGAGG